MEAKGAWVHVRLLKVVRALGWRSEEETIAVPVSAHRELGKDEFRLTLHNTTQHIYNTVIVQSAVKERSG